MPTLTRKQLEVFAAIIRCYRHNGYAPTLEEIAQAVGINTRSTIHKHVKALIDAEKLLAAPLASKRAYLLPEPEIHAHTPFNLPFAGRIAAGKPIEAVPDQISIDPSDIFTGSERYILEVKGESMIDIGIMDGDYIVIQHQANAQNGDIVVALVEREEATLKRIYYLADGNIELRPENRSMHPMTYPASSVQIQGKIVGLFRNYQENKHWLMLP